MHSNVSIYYICQLGGTISKVPTPMDRLFEPASHGPESTKEEDHMPFFIVAAICQEVSPLRESMGAGHLCLAGNGATKGQQQQGIIFCACVQQFRHWCYITLCSETLYSA